MRNSLKCGFETHGNTENYCRHQQLPIIFGEADFLPGIVVDKFSDVLVVESLALVLTD